MRASDSRGKANWFQERVTTANRSQVIPKVNPIYSRCSCIGEPKTTARYLKKVELAKPKRPGRRGSGMMSSSPRERFVERERFVDRDGEEGGTGRWREGGETERNGGGRWGRWWGERGGDGGRRRRWWWWWWWWWRRRSHIDASMIVRSSTGDFRGIVPDFKCFGFYY